MRRIRCVFRGVGIKEMKDKWEEARKDVGKEGHRRIRSLLDSTDGLDLEGLSVGAKLSVVLVLSSMTVTLHDVLVSTVTRILVAHPAVEERERLLNTQEFMVKMNCNITVLSSEVTVVNCAFCLLTVYTS